MTGVDLHAHVAPRTVLERMGLLRVDDGGIAVRLGERWQPVPAALLTPEALFQGPESEGIAIRVVSLPPFLLRHDLAPADGLTYSRAMNDGLAEIARRSGGRIRALATVPLQSPEAAAEELRRAVEVLGCDGVEIASNVAGRTDLDDPALDPFWRAAAELKALVLIHPHDVAGAGRMQPYHLRNLVGNPMETALAASRLLFGGVLRRHPDLRILLSHGGGALPWLLGRLDRGFRVRPESRTGGESPADGARRFLYDTVVHSPEILRMLVTWVGISQVVLGTDFPFDMGDPQAVSTVTRAIRDPGARRAILTGNAERLLAPVRPTA